MSNQHALAPLSNSIKLRLLTKFFNIFVLFTGNKPSSVFTNPYVYEFTEEK